MKSFRELVLEMPMKLPGDAPFETLDYVSKSARGMRDEFEFVADYKTLKIYTHKKLNWFVAGRFFEDYTEERFGIAAELSFTPKTFRETSNKILKERPVVSIDTIHVREAERRSGIASFLYKVLLLKYNVMSDKVQYVKASLMWKKFATETENDIYIYDAKEDKIVSKMSSKTPDSHIWSDDTSKMKIQMIMVQKGAK